MADILGGIKVNSMIWMATSLTLGALFICWHSCDKSDPAIMDTAMEYPYTIIFRVGMMYSLFIYFLIFLFIKWWLDSSQLASNTKSIPILGTLGLLSYGLFVACIDRKRINYPLAKTGVFFSSLLITSVICIIMKQLRKIRQQTPLFIGQTSWNLKKITSSAQQFAMFLAILITFGQLSIDHKNKVEYLVVISTILFIWTFIYDFKRFKMDIDRIPKKTTQQFIPNQTNPEEQRGTWNHQQLNSFESVQIQQG